MDKMTEYSLTLSVIQNSAFTLIFNLSVMVSTVRNNIAGKDSQYLQTFRGFALIETLVWLAA